MSTMRTTQEINAEIAALKAIKPSVRERSFFGDDNHAAIDAQIAVLTERMSMDEVYSRFGEDDSMDCDIDQPTEHELDCALNAHNWMSGALASDEQSPSESWGDLAK